MAALPPQVDCLLAPRCRAHACAFPPSEPTAWRCRPLQVCEECPNVQLAREAELLSVSVDAGMPDGHQITFFEEVRGGRVQERRVKFWLVGWLP